MYAFLRVDDQQCDQQSADAQVHHIPGFVPCSVVLAFQELVDGVLRLLLFSGSAFELKANFVK